MTTSDLGPTISEQAVALRQAGHSIREIREILGPVGNRTLNEALRDTPPPEWTRRPRAKDELRAQARKLRLAGLSLKQIATQIGVSKSSVSLWVRDLPCPPHLAPEELRKRRAESVRRFWEREYASRDEFRAAAAREIGELSERETFIAGAIAYWCEGSKTKEPRGQGARVVFVNSDPRLISFFLRFLHVAGTPQADLIFRVHIHESADVAAAQRFWQELTGADESQFRRPTLKRHNPKTVRKNTGEQYHGCLVINVRRSGDLYRRMEGWMYAIAS